MLFSVGEMNTHKIRASEKLINKKNLKNKQKKFMPSLSTISVGKSVDDFC